MVRVITVIVPERCRVPLGIEHRSLHNPDMFAP